MAHCQAVSSQILVSTSHAINLLNHYQCPCSDGTLMDSSLIGYKLCFMKF